MQVKELYGSRVLTKREVRVTKLVAQGLRNIDIAKRLGTTECMVKNYLRVIFDKVGVWSRLELALWYEARRLTSPKATAPGPLLDST